MKIERPTDVVISNGGKSQEFTIAASAKAFKILSSNLYQNKIRAIVRELSCNAFDAQKVNGSTEQIIIKAPTGFSPNFEIRDFGPGLSDEDVKTLYTTYFESTKAESNEFIGALGLGSKSPFSYTDVFTVISHHGGKERAYLCMIDNGIPTLKSLHVKDSNTTGLHIIVPVQPKDYETFNDEIHYVVSPFPKGSFSVEGSFDFPEDDFFTMDSSYLFTECNAIYGNIVYPLDKTPGIKYNALKQNYKQAFFRFELGELDITPSREELSFDEQTVKTIIERVNTKNAEVIAEHRDEYLSLIAESKFRQALRFAYNLPAAFRTEVLLGTPELNNKMFLDGLKFIKIYDEKWRLIKPNLANNPIATFASIHNTIHSIIVADGKYTISALQDETRYNGNGHIIIEPEDLDTYLRIFEGDTVNVVKASDLEIKKKPKQNWSLKTFEPSTKYLSNIDLDELCEDDFLLFESRDSYFFNAKDGDYTIEIGLAKRLNNRIVVAPLGKKSLKVFKDHQENNIRILQKFFKDNKVSKGLDEYFVRKCKEEKLLGFIVDRFSNFENYNMFLEFAKLIPEYNELKKQVDNNHEKDLAELSRIKELNPVIIKLLKSIYFSDLDQDLIDNITKLWVEQ